MTTAEKTDVLTLKAYAEQYTQNGPFEIINGERRVEADGVRLSWIVDPIRRKVGVYGGTSYVVLSPDDTLTAGDVIPSVEIQLGDLFRLLDEEEENAGES